MKSRNNEELSILRVALGEIQRAFQDVTDEQCIKILKKLIQGNLERIAEYEKRQVDTNISEELKKEIEILNSLLPKELSEQEVKDFLNEHVESIKLAKSEGMAIGIAMKAFKSANKNVSSVMVQNIVKNIRG